MEATVDDFPKVSGLVRSQLKFALRDEATKQLYEFEKDMLEVEYKVIRDRQLEELELEDDLLSKTPVRLVSLSYFALLSPNNDFFLLLNDLPNDQKFARSLVHGIV